MLLDDTVKPETAAFQKACEKNKMGNPDHINPDHRDKDSKDLKKARKKGGAFESTPESILISYEVGRACP